ncbi:MAG TPA: hypothetical protein VFC31_12845 [Candidatus Limnocylindria bacterium]|nr:hypothetical protein [Candidatus Limnocylindria bacterium]
MNRRNGLRVLVALATLILLLGTAGRALAHERREVGKYVIEMGWNDEPAVAGLLNAVYLEVRDKATDKGVENLQSALTVTVTSGGLTGGISLPFERGAEAGVYVARFLPTRAGDYVFRLTGKVGDQKIDERFESGPNRFDSVKAATSIAYPDGVDTYASLREIGERLGTLQLTAVAALVLALVSTALSALALTRGRSPKSRTPA